MKSNNVNELYNRIEKKLSKSVEVSPKDVSDVLDVLSKGMHGSVKQALDAIRGLHLTSEGESNDVLRNYKEEFIRESIGYFASAWYHAVSKGRISLDNIKEGNSFLISYMEFRRNRILGDIIENPVRFNSTCLMTNAREMAINDAKCKLMKYFTAALYAMDKNESYRPSMIMGIAFKDNL